MVRSYCIGKCKKLGHFFAIGNIYVDRDYNIIHELIDQTNDEEKKNLTQRQIYISANFDTVNDKSDKKDSS